MRAIGILGGTFDPVHNGHLRLAVETREALGLERVHLIPAREPPHRPPPRAEPEVRRRMLEAAVAGTPGLAVDDRELRREGPSYTTETLRSLRREAEERPLCLILGMDSFAALDTWHRWEELLELAHLGVAARPGATPPRTGPVAELLETRATTDPAAVHGSVAGSVHVVEVPLLEISATRIRSLVAGGRSTEFLSPEGVQKIIGDERLYRHGD